MNIGPETLRVLIGAAEAHYDDLVSGVEDGTYDADENAGPIAELEKHLGHANAMLRAFGEDKT